MGSLRILTNIYNRALTTKQAARKVLLSPYLIGHTPSLHLPKELNENGY